MNVKMIRGFVTFQNGFIAAAIVAACVAAGNCFSAAAYSASPEVDVNAEITGWLMTIGPGILSAIFGVIARWLNVDPEYVAAFKDFAKNPTMADIEQRAISAAASVILPRLGKYPEMAFPFLRAIAAAYSADPEVTESVAALSQNLSKAFLKDKPTG